MNALAISGQAERRRLESGNELLTVRGEITNQTDEVQRVPQIRAELKDAQGRVVYDWSIAPPVRELQPRGRVTFDSAEMDVPRGGRNAHPELRPDFLSTQASRPNWSRRADQHADAGRISEPVRRPSPAAPAASRARRSPRRSR